jgi:hypothetical protein
MEVSHQLHGSVAVPQVERAPRNLMNTRRTLLWPQSRSVRFGNDKFRCHCRISKSGRAVIQSVAESRSRLRYPHVWHEMRKLVYTAETYCFSNSFIFTNTCTTFVVHVLVKIKLLLKDKMHSEYNMKYCFSV